MFAKESIQKISQFLFSPRHRAFFIGVIAFSACPLPGAQGAISLAPGYFSSTYATAVEPAEMTFAPSGEMFVGANIGGDADVKIYKIPAGGGVSQVYGNSVIHDPDSVLFDASGTFSGEPGTVLVGGGTAFPPGGGLITAVYPDGTVVPILGPSSVIRNPAHLAFDSQNRLLMSDNLAEGVFVSVNGSTVSNLISLSSPARAMTLDANDQIFLNVNGTVRVYDSLGTLINASYETGLGNVADIAMGPGGARWGDDLYVADSASGRLSRVDPFGNRTILANGLNGVSYNIGFGPDNALYLSMREEGQILRIVPEPSSVAMLGILCLMLSKRRL